MKKWEEQNQKKIHQKKLLEAKSTFSTKSSSKNPSEVKSPPSGAKSQYGANFSSPQRSTFNNESPRSSTHSQISDYYSFEKQDLDQIPLYRLLRYYNLQQYAKMLISRGYGYDLTKLATLSRDDYDKLAMEIKMMPGHKVKLLKLASQVTNICYEIMDQDDLKQFKQTIFDRATSAETSKPKTTSTVRSQSGQKVEPKKPAEKRTSSSNEKKILPPLKTNQTSSGKKQQNPPQKLKTIKNTHPPKMKKLEKIGFDFFSDSQQSMDDEFSRILDNILEKYQGETEQAQFQPMPFLSHSRKHKDDHKLLQRINYSGSDELKSELQEAIAGIDSLKSSSLEKTSQNKNEKSNTKINDEKSVTQHNTSENSTHSSSRSSQKDGSKNPVHVEDSQSKKDQTPKDTKDRARVIELLEKKLDQNHLNKNDLNLEFKKINDMYSSFDGAKMTSTIANLDIEEMSYCLACAIEKHVEYFVENIYPNGNFLVPIKKEETNKEEDLSKLRYNISTQAGPMKSIGQATNAKGGNDVGSSPDKEADRFSTQGGANDANDLEDLKEVCDEEIEEDNFGETLEDEKELGNNIMHNQEEDDEVLHHESGGVFVVGDEEEEEKLENEDLENCGPIEFRPEGRMYSTGFDPYVRRSLDIISEKSYETSQNTAKMHENIKNNHQDTQEHQNEEETVNEGDKEAIEGFLRESLRDSLLFNIKQEKNHETQSNLQPSCSLKGFSVQIYPTQTGEYQTESNDLRSQVMNGVDNAGVMREKQVMQNRKAENEHVIYERGNDWTEASMEESLYSELELDYQNMDIAKRIKMVFDKTYNEKNLTPEEFNKKIQTTVNKESASNYCKNIVITTKMEKEVIIICLVYIERLIIRTNMYLNAVNWKRITFAALILASKIWDDESFENASFAKAFPQYTTREINELERVFLEFLDYDLMINASDYSKYYFVLRTFAEKNKKSFPLKAINLQTVRQLQKRAATTSKTLKDVYADPLNKTFS